MKRAESRRWLRMYFFASVAAMLMLLVFGFGVAVGAFKIFPYPMLEASAAAARDWIRYPRHNARLRPEKFLAPGVSAARTAGTRSSGTQTSGAQSSGTQTSGAQSSGTQTSGTQSSGTRSSDMPSSDTQSSGAAFPGVTFVDGFFGRSNGMRLLDMQGEVLHEWRVAFNELWPSSDHVGRPLHDWDAQIHGAILYPNGDVVFNFQYAGLARIDRCGKPLWRVPRQTHHSVHEDEHGHLWVPARRQRGEPHPSLPDVPVPYFEDLVLELTPRGEIVREISVLDAIAEAGHEGLLFSNGAHGAVLNVPLDGDFTHLNDVETLSSTMADAFPMFAAGDILLSLRNLNLLLVLDGATAALKWWMVGPYMRQHDPDFLPSGRISVFDNRRDGASGTDFGGSRILEIDPVTREVVVVYGGQDGQRFYTETMGDHQHLPNGNVLITESEEGHAFEVTPSGDVAWSYANVWEDGSAAMISRAVRYPSSYANSIDTEVCADE